MKLERFEQLPIIGIVRGATTEQVLKVVEAAMEAGLCTLEITLNRVEAVAQIERLHEAFGHELELGAGTVLKAEAADAAINAGARFIVTPAVLPEVIQVCREREVPVFPGAMTPTEILYAHWAGAAMVKVFPAGSLGPGYIKALRGPFPQIPLMPTGGVSVESIPDYFRAGANAVGIGGEIFKREWLETGNIQAVAEAARAFVKAVKESPRQ